MCAMARRASGPAVAACLSAIGRPVRVDRQEGRQRRCVVVGACVVLACEWETEEGEHREAGFSADSVGAVPRRERCGRDRGGPDAEESELVPSERHG